MAFSNPIASCLRCYHSCRSKARIHLKSLVCQGHGIIEPRFRHSAKRELGAKQELIGTQVARAAFHRPRRLCFPYLRSNTANNAGSDAVLQIEDIVQNTFILFRPKMTPGLGFVQLSRDTDPSGRAPYRAFEHIPHAKIMANSTYVRGSPLVGKRGTTCDDKQTGVSRQRRDDILNYSVGEILLVRIATHIVKWKDSDRRTFSHDANRYFAASLRALNVGDTISPDSHRFVDVLQILNPAIFKWQIERGANLPERVIGNAQAARRRETFEPGRDIDAITIDVPLVDDDVADVDTNPKLDSAINRNDSVAFGHRTLDFHSAADRIHGTRKL